MKHGRSGYGGSQPHYHKVNANPTRQERELDAGRQTIIWLTLAALGLIAVVSLIFGLMAL